MQKVSLELKHLRKALSNAPEKKEKVTTDTGMTVKTEYGTYHNCRLVADRYLLDESLCIRIVEDDGEGVAILTVCLDAIGLKSNEAFVDTNNCPWADSFIETYELGTFTGKKKPSGYCVYPLYQFDMDKVGKYT